MGQVQGVWENLMEDEGNFAVFIVNIKKNEEKQRNRFVVQKILVKTVLVLFLLFFAFIQLLGFCLSVYPLSQG